MADDIDPRLLAEAEALDEAIERALGGRPAPTTDPAVTWLAAAVRSDPPPRLARRVEAEHARREHLRWRPVQIVAALLAANLLSHGLGNFFVGAWVSRGLGEHYSPHAFREGGLALIAAGIAVAAGSLRRSWIPVSVGAGVPLGIAFGIYGIPEIGQFAAGAALHLSQGALGILLAITWWRAHRYGRRAGDEHPV